MTGIKNMVRRSVVILQIFFNSYVRGEQYQDMFTAYGKMFLSGTQAAVLWAAAGSAALAMMGLSYWFAARLIYPTGALAMEGRTPYDVLGVNVRSKEWEIAEAYTSMEKVIESSNLSKKERQSHMLEADGSYEMLTDDFLRCQYHMDNNAPDWYGVPTMSGRDNHRSTGNRKGSAAGYEYQENYRPHRSKSPPAPEKKDWLF